MEQLSVEFPRRGALRQQPGGFRGWMNATQKHGLHFAPLPHQTSHSNQRSKLRPYPLRLVVSDGVRSVSIGW